MIIADSPGIKLGGVLGKNNCPRGQNFALNWAQGEVEVSLKNKKTKKIVFIYFFRICIKSFHKQAVMAI